MKRFATGLSVVVLAAAVAGAAVPWRIPRSTVGDALSAMLPRGAGLHAVVAGPVTLRLLPRPRLQATDLSVTAGDGALALDAPSLKAELDIPSLLTGSWAVSSATLIAPTIGVDLDRLGEHPAAAAEAAPGRPVALRLRSGLIQLRSRAGAAGLLATDMDASATWSGDGEDLALSGVATWRGTTAQFAGSLDHPALSLTPEGSAASFHAESPIFSVSAAGLLSGGAGPAFAGHASLATPALPALLRRLDGFPVALASRRAQIAGDLVAKPHELSLSDAQLRLDGARFEGTLAWRREGGRGVLAGTLATDRLDLDALLGRGPERPSLAALYRRAMTTSPLGFDVDMRVSASRALAALVRGDRLELTLDEARAYGGTVKARALAVLGPDGIDAHAEIAARAVDLGALSDGLSGSPHVGGTLTARAALDGRGASFSGVVAALAGDGQVTVEDGRLSGLSLGQALRRLGRRVPIAMDGRDPPTTFDRAQWDVQVRDGVVRIPDGRLTAPGLAASFTAETALPDGRVDVRAVASEVGRGGSAGENLPFALSGSWADPLVRLGRGAAEPLGGGPGASP